MTLEAWGPVIGQLIGVIVGFTAVYFIMIRRKQ